MSSDQDQRVGEIVARARQARGLSQQAVAEAMRARAEEHRWSQATVWKMERGDRPLKAAEVRDLSNVLHVSVSVLIDPSQANVTKQSLVEQISHMRVLWALIRDKLEELQRPGEFLRLQLPMVQKHRQLESDQDWAVIADAVTRAHKILVRYEALQRAIDALLEETALAELGDLFDV